MPRFRANGGVIGAANSPSGGVASGIWTQQESAQYLQTSAWPQYGFFQASPAIGGLTLLANPGAVAVTVPAVYTLTALNNFSATVKVWGAGGSGWPNGNAAGGSGGYSTGVVTFAAGQTYTVVCGEQGYTTGQPRGNYIGGGGVGPDGSGAGYSGIFLGAASQANALLIAGGGGSGANNGGINAWGGAGGGSSGNAGGVYSFTSGQGGTQSAGGAGSNCTPAGGTGQALLGGNYGGPSGAGGGGGYWGGGGCGGSTNVSAPGAGGGSGYFKPSAPVASGSTTTGNNGGAVANAPPSTADANYSAPAGYGGANGSNGSAGRLVIVIP